MYAIQKNFKLILAVIGLLFVIFIIKKPEISGQYVTDGVLWYFKSISGIVEKLLTPIFDKILQG